ALRRVEDDIVRIVGEEDPQVRRRDCVAVRRRVHCGEGQLRDLSKRQAVGPRVDYRAACRAPVWIWAELDAVERRGDSRVASRKVPAEAKHRRRGLPGRALGAHITLRPLSASRACWTSRAGGARSPCWPARTARTSRATREVHLFLPAPTLGSRTTLDVVTRVRVAGELNAEDEGV